MQHLGALLLELGLAMLTLLTEQSHGIADEVVDFYHRAALGNFRREVQIALDQSRGQKFLENVGSPYYMAPEVLKRNYGPEALNAQSRAILMEKLDRSGITSSIPAPLGAPLVNGSTPTQADGNG